MNQEFINELAGKLQTIGSLHAIGDTWISFDSTIPAGGVPFFGQLVDRTLWKDLFNWATNKGKIKSESEWQSYANSHGGNCPYYSEGDGSTTFRVPKVSSYLKGVTTTDDGGSYISEGLPNITGKVGQSYNSDTIQGGWFNNNNKGYGEGALYLDGSTSSFASGWSTYSNVGLIAFDASRSNSIYGNSDHVTPETYGVIVGVYAVGIVSNIGNLDAGELSSTVAKVEAKIDTKLENSTVHLVETWKAEDGTGWYRKYSDGWIEQGGEETSNNTWNTTTFPLSFTDIKYNVVISGIDADGGSAGQGNSPCYINGATKTITSFQHTSVSVVDKIVWYACGY